MKNFRHHRFPENTKEQTRNAQAFSITRAGLGNRAAKFSVWCLAFGVFIAPFAHAQTNAAIESRYLLIFDTSSALKRRSENVQRAVGELISSGMNGQMHAGDTMGFWTFNESLYAGNLPVIRWTPENRMKIAAKVTEFLRAQKYEKQSRLEVMLPAMQRLITNSVKLTVLIFSDGTGQMSGTPFDAEINAAYAPFRDTQKQEHMPFITVLRAWDREYLGYAVTPAPWVVEFPKFPPDPVVIVSKVVPKPEPPRPVVPPLIVIGKKTESTTPAVELPQPGTETKPVEKPGMTEAEKLFARLAAEQGLTVPTNQNSATKVPPSAAETAHPTSAPTENSQPAQTPVTAETPKPAPVEAKSAPPKTDLAPSSSPVASHPPVTETNIVSAVQAVVAPVEKSWTRLLLLGAGVSLLVVALGVVYALMRRRLRPSDSLITSSMDRDRK